MITIMCQEEGHCIDIPSIPRSLISVLPPSHCATIHWAVQIYEREKHQHQLLAKKRNTKLTPKTLPHHKCLSLPSHCATIHWAVQTLEKKTPTQIIHEPKYDAILLLGNILECVAKDVFSVGLFDICHCCFSLI